MKRIITTIFAATLLLTGCGQVDEKARNRDQSASSQIINNNEKTITRIIISETGGEDGRDNEWEIFQLDGCNIVIQKDNRFRKTAAYHITDEEYHALVDIDFSSYIGKTEDNEGIADWVFYNTKIIYDDKTDDVTEVYIPELFNELYTITSEYEPFPESGNIGEYAYKAINSGGYFEADFSGASKYDKCFYLEKDSHPDSPLEVYIYGGEYGHGGYFMNVADLRIDNDTLFVTLYEGLYEAPEYTEEIMTTCCKIEIKPGVSNVIVKNTGGCDFKQIEKAAEPSKSTNSSNEMYFKEPEPENIVYDEEHGLSYVKNQLLISTSPDTERSKVVEMLSTGNYGEVQIVGEIALTGDYQVEFSDEHSLSEMQEIADYYLVFPFVENVTLNIISETAPAESEVSEVEDGWIAKLNGGSGEITYHTYVYEAENGYKYINTTSTTVSYGSPQWNERVIDSGSVSTKEEIVQVAKDNGSKQYVLFPDDKEAYKISDFLSMD